MREALLVIDMVHDFMDARGALYCGDQARNIIPNVQDLLQQHRQRGSLIVFVADNHAPDDKEFARFAPHCLAGSQGAQFIPELTPQANEAVIKKNRFNSFTGTDLADILAREQVTLAHLTGVCTSICVMESCASLLGLDYEVMVHKDCVADFDPAAHEFALKRMANILGARVK